MSENAGWRDEPLEQLLLVVTAQPLRPEMLKLIDLPKLLEQLKPAIDVLHFGGKVIGPAEVAILDRMKLVPQENVEWMARPSLIPQISHVWQGELARRKASP